MHRGSEGAENDLEKGKGGILSWDVRAWATECHAFGHAVRNRESSVRLRRQRGVRARILQALLDARFFCPGEEIYLN
jgi:hypothetical protein